MEDLLSFLTVRLKQKKMTVNEFCGLIGISRQKFYRFVKEPHRFPAESVRSMISALSLNESEIRQLESFLHPQQQPTETVFEGSEYRSPDLSYYGGQIENLLRYRMSAETAPGQETIMYSQAGRHVTMLSPVSFARVLAGSAGSPDNSGLSKQPSAPIREYELILYNCIPADEAPSAKQINASVKSIKIIAGIVKELEDALISSCPVRIRIRHCMTKERIGMMLNRDPGNRTAMSFQLRLLNAVLPLLSAAEDYRIETAEDAIGSWTPKGDVCMIKHVCRYLPETASFTDRPSLTGRAIRTEYYTLIFSESGECRACRLGSDEASHIYRFLSPDGTGTISLSGSPAIANPSLELYERYRDCRVIVISPDLCFDDIPSRMWMDLVDEIQRRSDRKHYEKVFRKLIDPFGQYMFLSFEDLVRSVLNTMEQRRRTAGRMGHCVICHPSGLAEMVRTGMISALSAGSEDCTGGSWSPVPLRFPVPAIRDLLEMMRSSILRRQAAGVTDPAKCDWVNYYILHPQFPVPEIAFHLYSGRGVAPLYTKGRYRYVLDNLFDSTAAAVILFDYVKNEMIGKRGEELSSSVLSDAHSVALIDSLINSLDEMETGSPASHTVPEKAPDRSAAESDIQ